jgi:hypothetical protein
MLRPIWHLFCVVGKYQHPSRQTSAPGAPGGRRPLWIRRALVGTHEGQRPTAVTFPVTNEPAPAGAGWRWRWQLPSELRWRTLVLAGLRRLIGVRSVVQLYPGPFCYPLPREYLDTRGVIIFVMFSSMLSVVLSVRAQASSRRRAATACCIDAESARW